MCGIIAVLQRRPAGAEPSLDELFSELDALVAAPAGDSAELAASLEALDARLRGPLGVAALLRAPDGVERLAAAGARLEALVREHELALDAAAPAGLEAANAALLRLKDAVWALAHDRPDTARGVRDLLGPSTRPSLSLVCGFWAIEVALAALDRLEVRGRDSAGINVLVSAHALGAGDPRLEARTRDPLYTSLAVREVDGTLSFVYKVAAEIGELGDNTSALRAAIRSDDLLRAALSGDDAQATVLGHTRWASVGMISEPNAHPLAAGGVFAAVNGDVDNYRELLAGEDVAPVPEISTDAQVVPELVRSRLAQSADVDSAFAETVAQCEGSAAIAAMSAAAPDRLHLALRGSGQSLYVGLAQDAYVVASEPYGVVQETQRYVPMESEGRTGQLVLLDRAAAGTIEGVLRLGYDGASQPIGPESIKVAEITPRDIDRAGFPHFLLKEISEAPLSFQKTLRGKIVEDELLSVRLDQESLPEKVSARLADGTIRRILVVAQGTAAVAGHSVATALAKALAGHRVAVVPMLATELSGFGLADDMGDTLVVAVSQSGTTTDTNRTVDLVRGRGAAVIAIVNRRNSDLVEKADGVLYTSDGRDVEMSVASTKAFYAQVAAGWILALALAQRLDRADAREADRLLRGLQALPEAMTAVLARRPEIAAAAAATAPSRRHWAVVGNGPNRVAAEEVRIKLSELCYHAIACDGTEDKKHIDLSSEPLIFVCAAGLEGPNADDVAKEVAIFNAHKAEPVVIAGEGEGARFAAARHVIEVPAVEPEFGFVLSAMAGHLFGYEAALAIDASARPLREARVAVESAVEGRATFDDADLQRLGVAIREPAARFFAGLGERRYDGNLEAATAVRVASLLRYAIGAVPVEAYELESGRVGTPQAIVEDLAEALSEAVSELTRPVDAIKHQAKTVTVGISRSEDALLGAPLVQATVDAGAPLNALSYRAMRTLAALGAAVEEVTGFTRYAIEGDVERDATVGVVAKGGIAAGLPSRTDTDNRLLGAKHRAASKREVTVAVGARDGRSLILVPEVVAGQVTGLTLLHIEVRDRLGVDETRALLVGYRDRYTALADAVTETEPAFDDALLETIPLIELLTAPVHVLARRWKARSEAAGFSGGERSETE